ncbi:hypothetical protein [Paracoccus jiaweipingae]|uniref:hypothetical protein n=1 Tax=unclassified Paracoccus (in: a-proteobacteria) TaxID=2688777 RepID=UPI00378F1168
MTTPQPGRWPLWKLALLLYPFAGGVVWINLFMLALMGNAIGLGSLDPVQSVRVAVLLGIPAAWASARWVRGLMDQADAG